MTAYATKRKAWHLFRFSEEARGSVEARMDRQMTTYEGTDDNVLQEPKDALTASATRALMPAGRTTDYVTEPTTRKPAIITFIAKTNPIKPDPGTYKDLCTCNQTSHAHSA